MLLHQHFIHIAKKFGTKTAIIDRTTGKSISYGKALIASLILADKFRKYEEGFIGIMIPTSAFYSWRTHEWPYTCDDQLFYRCCTKL